MKIFRTEYRNVNNAKCNRVTGLYLECVVMVVMHRFANFHYKNFYI